MIDIHLLVYAGTLAVFIVCAFAVGILCVVVFTALATVAGIKKPRRNHQVHHEHADAVHGGQLLAGLAHPEEWEAAAAPVSDDSALAERLPAGERRTGLRRPARPRPIQHI